MSQDWNFPVDHSDQWDGFNDSGINHFTGLPIVNLAREVAQNSLDARSSVEHPVRLMFRLHKCKPEEIPGVESLRQTLQQCLEAAADPAKSESDNAQKFFERALQELKRTTISVLEISDYNTTGVIGPCKQGSPYHAFMKSRGLSVKSSNTAGGSFGIGKFAPFAVSQLRSVFVSTVYKSGEDLSIQLTQGKSILMSHYSNGCLHQATGFWGESEQYSPVQGTPDLPDWLLRCRNVEKLQDAVGTKLTVLCPDLRTDWREQLTVALLQNYFGAILDKTLTLDVDGKYSLNSETLRGAFEDQALLSYLSDRPELRAGFENCKAYIEALTSAPAETSERKWLGLCELRILVKDDLPKKVCFLRNGMFVSDTLKLARLQSFSEFKEFIAVFRCLNAKGNERLRAMEPPKHDQFLPEHLFDEKQRDVADKELRDLAGWIRDCLKRHAKDPVSEITPIDELSTFFYDEGPIGPRSKDAERHPQGQPIVTLKGRNLPRMGPRLPVAKSGVPAVPGGNDPFPGNEPPVVTGATPTPLSSKAFLIQDPRTIMQDVARRKVWFTPLSSGEVQVALLAAGADSDVPLFITHASQGALAQGRVQTSVIEHSRVVIEVELSSQFTGALKVIVYEV